jgi:hypothetical protein
MGATPFDRFANPFQGQVVNFLHGVCDSGEQKPVSCRRHDCGLRIEFVRFVIAKGTGLLPGCFPKWDCRKTSAQRAVETWDVVHNFGCRGVMRKVPPGARGCRDARCRTRTAKLLNSNSFIATNNRFGLPVESVKNFIIIFELRSFPSNLSGGQ